MTTSTIKTTARIVGDTLEVGSEIPSLTVLPTGNFVIVHVNRDGSFSVRPGCVGTWWIAAGCTNPEARFIDIIFEGDHEVHLVHAPVLKPGPQTMEEYGVLIEEARKVASEKPTFRCH